MDNYLFTSDRLGFRNWSSSDLKPFSEMNSDAKVMEFFPSTLTPIESNKLVERLQNHFDDHDFTFFAVDTLADQTFIGFIGMVNMNFDAYFTPGVEIGWRLFSSAWGKGYGTEGALRCLEYAYNDLGINKIYSFTSLLNIRSENLMKRIGMIKKGEFNHPKIDKDHPLSLHCLYEIVNAK